jgi:hypothetical protein
MTMRSVNQQIRAATSTGVIGEDAAKGIINEAEKGRLTNGEVKVIVDAFEAACRADPQTTTLMANYVFSEFFQKHRIPAGGAGYQMRADILSVVGAAHHEGRLWASPVTGEPPQMDKLIEVLLDGGSITHGGRPVSLALVDVEKKEFYYSQQPIVFPKPEPRYYGPFPTDVSRL